MDEERLLSYHRFTREHGVNRPLYFLARLLLVPFFLIYFRLSRIGREHGKVKGPLIVAANHRSFLDPFVIGASPALAAPAPLRREGRALRDALAGLDPEPARRLSGAPRPVRRGDPDHLARGARARRRRLHLPGGDPAPDRLARPAEARLRPPRARDRRGRPARSPCTAPSRSAAAGGSARRRSRSALGRALTFPRTEEPVAGARQLGRRPRLAGDRAAVGVARRPAAAAQGGGDRRRQLGDRRRGAARPRRPRGPARHPHPRAGRGDGRDPRPTRSYLPGVQLPDSLTVKRAADIELAGIDLVCLAVPSAALPQAVGAIGDRVGQRASVLLLSKGMVAPMAALPSEYVSERIRARAVASLGGPAHAKEAVSGNGGARARQPRRRPARPARRASSTRPGLVCERSEDMIGVEIAGAAKNAAALAGAAAQAQGMNAAGIAAAQVWRECVAYAAPSGPSTRPSPASPASAT